MRLALIGVPTNSSGLTTGEARAPAALRSNGLVAALRQSAPVVDRGEVAFAAPTPDRDPHAGIIAPETLVQMVEGVRAEVGRAIAREEIPLVIGGDCPLLLGCLAAARDAFGRVGLLFIDGHEDAWTPHGSSTGEAADMELGLALGVTTVTGLDRLQALLPLLHPADTVVLGPRDREEIAAAGESSIAPLVTFRDDHDLRQGEASDTVTMLVSRLQADTGRWWLHLDLDVLSTAAMPAVSYPQPGGLSWAELEMAMAAALPVPGLIGWDVTIYNPDLDPDGHAAARIVAFLGDMAVHLR